MRVMRQAAARRAAGPHARAPTYGGGQARTLSAATCAHARQSQGAPAAGAEEIVTGLPGCPVPVCVCE